MKILITGGAGFIGSNCVEYFAKQGHEIIVLDNLSRSRHHKALIESVEHNWRRLTQIKNVELIFGDVCESLLVVKIFQEHEIDVIIHTAAQSGVRLSMKNPILDFTINACGTINLLEATRKFAKEATFIFLSTNKVYGENVDCITAVDEHASTMLTRRTPFGTSKYVGDLYTQEYGKTYGIKTGVFRLSCIYGPNQYGFEDQGWVAHLVISNYMERPITIYGDGDQIRDLLYISDLIQVFDKFIQSDKVQEVYNVGGGIQNANSVLAVLKKIEEETRKGNQIQHAEARLADQHCYISNIQKVSQELGWKPLIKFRSGLKALVQWVKEHEDNFIEKGK